MADEENPMALATAARAMQSRIKLMHDLAKRLESLCARMDALTESENSRTSVQPVIFLNYSGTTYQSNPDHRITELFKEITIEEIRTTKADIAAIAKELSE